MNAGLVYSIMLHAAVVALAVFGLPRLADDRPLQTRLVVVDVVTVSEVTNAPPPAEVAEVDDKPPPPAPVAAPPPPPPAPRPTAPAPPPPPPVETTQVPEPAPSPPPVPVEKPEVAETAEPVPETPVAEPEPVEVEAAPEPEPAAVAEAPPPDPEPAAVAEAPPPDPVPLPQTRPTPPAPRPEPASVREAPQTPEPPKKEPEKTDDFLNVLKTVQQLKTEAPRQREEQTEPRPQVQAETTARRATFNPDQPLSVSEMDAIRRQISNCWLVPAGAKNAEDLAVEIEVTMNQDRTVRFAEVLDRSRMTTDQHFRSAAEAALRALKSPACSPLLLPADKFETWKRFTITFDPKDMLS